MLILLLFFQALGQISVPLKKPRVKNTSGSLKSSGGQAYQLINYKEVKFIQYLYTTTVYIGAPAQEFSLQIDTGSPVLTI